MDWQADQARGLGLTAPATLAYDRPLPRRVSVLPSKLIETLRRLGADCYVARAGNGVIAYEGGAAPVPQELPVALLHRVKAAYDPRGVLPT